MPDGSWIFLAVSTVPRRQPWQTCKPEVANLADVMVSLTAEIGLNYIDMRTYQSRLARGQGQPGHAAGNL